MKHLFDIAGKVAVVTGGSRGIGAMIARGFVENGVKTYITARKVDELMATAEALSDVGECIALPSNLGSFEGVTAFAAAIREREQKLHILVNNAGATWGAPIDEFPESGWDKVMDLNVKSLFFLTRELLPALRAAGTAEDPARVIGRCRGNILEPREAYELSGQVPNVVFPSGLIVEEFDAEGFALASSPVKIYYGAADTSVGLAETTIGELLEAASEGSIPA